MNVNTALIVILVTSIILLLAKLAKVFLKKDTFLGVLILFKTQKLTWIVEKLAKYKRFLKWFTNLGLVLGFGAFGLDYLTKNKIKQKNKRFLLFIISTIVLSIICYFVIGNIFLNNPIVPKVLAYFIIAITGIMGLSGFIIGSLIFSAVDIIAKLIIGQVACPGVGLVIPGVKMPKVDFFVPWYGWIILIFSAAIHEFFHGALLKKFKLKIKSIGVLLLGILPMGAFVEPDEKELRKTEDKKVIEMYTAGPTSNIILAIIFGIILIIVSSASQGYLTDITNQSQSGLMVHSVDQNTNICGSIFENPAYGVLEKNDVIVSINDQEIKNTNDLKLASDKTKENKFVVYNQDNNQERTVYLETNELGTYGFKVDILKNKDFTIPTNYYFLKTLINVLLWIALLNFLIGTVNFMPSVPFDGAFISQVIFADFLNKKNSKRKRKNRVGVFFLIFINLLILLNILPYFF